MTSDQTLWEEIHQQPDRLEAVIEGNRRQVSRIGALIDGSDVGWVLIAARGTSDNAARYAQYVWGARNGLAVASAAPSLFGGYHRPPLLDGALVVGISQSGQSPDLVGVLEEAKKRRRPTLAITNDPGSPLASAADEVLALYAGEERAVAATKTYTCQLAVVAMLSEALAGEPDPGSSLAGLPDQVAAALGLTKELESAVATLVEDDRCAVLARGFQHATAFEWALKLQELAQVLAQPYSTADFRHGPVALVEPGFPVLAIATAGELEDDVDELIQSVAKRGAELLVLDDRPDSSLPGAVVQLAPGVPEWLAPIPTIVVAQLAAYHLTRARGLDPDAPRGLRKVTRTV